MKSEEEKIIRLLDGNLREKEREGLKTGLTPEGKKLCDSLMSMDGLLKRDSIEPAPAGFEDSLMAELQVARKATSWMWVLKWISLSLGLVLVASILVFLLSSETATTHPDILWLVGKASQVGPYFDSGMVMQFFVIIEGLVLLVIIEKIMSRRRMFRRPDLT